MTTPELSGTRHFNYALDGSDLYCHDCLIGTTGETSCFVCGGPLRKIKPAEWRDSETRSQHTWEAGDQA